MNQLKVYKSDDEKRQVFGWASVAVRVDGEVVEDFQEDVIDICDLEAAVYPYVMEYGDCGEMHRRSHVGKLIESVVFTAEKAAAMGIPEEIVPLGWWVGFYIEDFEVWEKVKSGEYGMFSIEGTGERVEFE